MTDPTDQAATIDPQRVEAMAVTMLTSIRANYQIGPTARARWYEAANALAVASAILIAGVGADRAQAVEWIAGAVGRQLASIDRGELPLSGNPAAK